MHSDVNSYKLHWWTHDLNYIYEYIDELNKETTIITYWILTVDANKLYKINKAY